MKAKVQTAKEETKALKSIKRGVLGIVAKLYGQAVKLRNILYDRNLVYSYKSNLKVVSVGNLSCGGNAKTPICITIANLLQHRGFKPVLLTRGYKGKTKGPYLIKAEDTPELVGDEAFLLAQSLSVPVVVSRDRAKGARFIEREQLGDLILLDDAFQHRRLKRDVDIVSVNVENENAVEAFLAGELLPLGRFREDRDRALKRAHILIFSERRPLVSGSELDMRLFKPIPKTAQIYRSYLTDLQVKSITNDKILNPCEVVALCAIANPAGFLDTLSQLRFSVKAHFTFQDHHFFATKEIEEILNSFPDLPVICTAKDVVKLKSFSIEKLYVLNTKTEIIPSDAFGVQLSRLCKR